jgi:predicted Zn-dependent peptidase
MESVTLKNGFKVVYEKPKNVIPIAAIYLFIRQGSVNESEGTRGGSHIIEHMCFKGTRKIPDSKDISIKFDEIGAYFNAFTDKHMTCYTVKCAEFFVENCLQILSDMVMNSRFSKQDFDKEQNIVKEETIKNEASESIRVFKTMDSLLYDGSALAYPIDDISYHAAKFDYKTIYDLYHGTYRPDNMVLSVVTHVPFIRIKRMMDHTFFHVNSHRTLCDSLSSISFSTNILPQSGIKYQIRKSDVVKSVYLAVGFRTCSYFHADVYALELLSVILAGTMSGRLFILLREKNAVTYSSEVDTNYYSYSGDFIIHTSSDYSKIIENNKGESSRRAEGRSNKKGVLPLIIGEINNLIRHGITEKELHIAKGYMKGKYVINLENCQNQAMWNGEYAIMEKYNQGKTFVKYSDLYDKYVKPLKCSDITRVIKTYFIKENMGVVLSGKHVPSLDKVEKICGLVI